MLARGVYVIGFFHPVVPQGKARIRTQISAAHTREDLVFAIEQFTAVKAELGLYRNGATRPIEKRCHPC
jgi:glycine C-acetyltransferase